MVTPEVRDRARAAMFGFAVGDALGATTEFLTPAEIRHRYGVHRTLCGGGWLGLKPGQITDDTGMLLALAEAVAEAGRWDLGAIARGFAAWLRSRPVDVGATCARGIRRFLVEGTFQAPPNEWDAGNGGAMRAPAAGIASLASPVRAGVWAVRQARITHNHPLSDAASAAVALMVRAAVLGRGFEAVDGVARALARRHPEFRATGTRPVSSPYVVDTLRTVFFFLRTTGSFEDCLVGVVNQGGDADTAGALAGAVAGGLGGTTAIPRAWLRRLDLDVRERLEAAAERLVRLGA
ncbi:MAG: ADP-ribosyl-[dinitrogen reductase] hydrolase [Candidatus Dadabacteria bacterium]|nr:MAG: ADP-ribosyl-[dinitrogen reductase] hydrolase [Candidatus Dadabacteria bacterium]